MVTKDKRDIVIIGAGTAGYVAGIRARQLGRRVAIIESDKIGGTCLNCGCIPGKVLFSTTRLLTRARQAARYGIKIDIAGIDIARLDDWKNGVVQRLRDGLHYLMSAHKLELLFGRAVFVSDRVISVELANGDELLLEAENFIIAAGSSARVLPPLAFDGKRILSPEQVMTETPSIPSQLAIIGGGVIAVELAGICQSLGAKVAIVQRSDILRGFDRDIRRICGSSLRNIGAEIFTNTELEGIDDSQNLLRLKLKRDNQSFTLDVDKLIVAIGRKPNTDGLGLEETGISLDSRGFIMVNERRETGVPDIYAAGDVTGPPLLAHKASAEGACVADIIAGVETRFLSRFIPRVIFSACEAASVGLSEEEAKRNSDKVRIGYFPFTASGNAIANDSTDGFVKVIADQVSDRILGIHIGGDGAAELIGEATLALQAGMRVKDFAEIIRPHPAQSEAFTEAALDIYSQAIHFFRPPQAHRR